MDAPHAASEVAQVWSPVRTRLLLIVGGAVLALGVLLAAPALACTPHASVTFSPETAEAGSTVTLTGNKHQPNEAVQVHLHSASGPLLAQTVTDFHGVFTAQVTIPAGTPDGVMAIMVRQGEVPGGALIHREGSTYPGAERMWAFSVTGGEPDPQPDAGSQPAELVSSPDVQAVAGSQPETVPAESDAATGTQPETVSTQPSATAPVEPAPRAGTDPMVTTPPAAPAAGADTHTPSPPANQLPTRTTTAPGELQVPSADPQPAPPASAPAGTPAAAEDASIGVPPRTALTTTERVLLATGSTTPDVPRATTSGERMLLATAPVAEPDVDATTDRTPRPSHNPAEPARGQRAMEGTVDQRDMPGTPGAGMGLLAIGLVLIFGGFTVADAIRRRQTERATRRRG